MHILGIRLGNSFHKQTINEYDVYSKHRYWQEESTIENYEIGEKQDFKENELRICCWNKSQSNIKFLF